MAFCCHLVQVTVLPGWHCLGQDRTRQHADICMLDLLIGYPENHNLSGQRPTLANTEKKKLHQKSISKKETGDFGRFWNPIWGLLRNQCVQAFFQQRTGQRTRGPVGPCQIWVYDAEDTDEYECVALLQSHSQDPLDQPWYLCLRCLRFLRENEHRRYKRNYRRTIAHIEM